MLSNQDIIAKLSNGAVGVIPTDTVYGVVCSARDPQAVARLYALKNRANKTGTVIAASIEQLVQLGIHRRYLKAVEQFWPNPISIEMPVEDNLAYIHQGLNRFAVRIPKDPAFLKLLNETGPLLSSSANQPGEPPAVNIEQAKAYFGDESDFYMDAGDLSGRLPSTVIRMIDDAVEVVREGAVAVSEYGVVTEK